MEELVGWTGRKKSLILFYQSPGIIRPKLNWDFGNKLICNLAPGYTSNDWPTVTMLSNVKAHWPWSFRPTVAHLSLQVIPHHVTLSEVGWHLSVEVLMQVAGLDSDWLHEVVQTNTAAGDWLELLHKVVRILGSSDFLVMSEEIPDYEVTYPKLL